MKRHSDIIIKVLSLGIGLAVGIVLIAKVFFELSYDSFYKDIDRVYTIRTWISQNGDEKDSNGDEITSDFNDLERQMIKFGKKK